MASPSQAERACRGAAFVPACRPFSKCCRDSNRDTVSSHRGGLKTSTSQNTNNGAALDGIGASTWCSAARCVRGADRSAHLSCSRCSISLGVGVTGRGGELALMRCLPAIFLNVGDDAGGEKKWVSKPSRKLSSRVTRHIAGCGWPRAVGSAAWVQLVIATRQGFPC